MPTIAQQLKEEGKVEIAKQLLKENIGLGDTELMALVKHLTGLSDDKINQLKKY